jgi:hypothetical protein
MGGEDIVFAKAGDRVVTPSGEYICRVKNDIIKGMTPLPKDFEDWQYDQPKPLDPFGKGFRWSRQTGAQVCIEGTWKP